jgi:uncharacterized protein with PhoU and TrkA domain
MIAGQLHAVEQIELGPSSGLCGQTVAQVRAMYGRLVIELLRGSSIMLLPPLETVLVAGDSIMALGPINRIERIRIPGSERPATARL